MRHVAALAIALTVSVAAQNAPAPTRFDTISIKPISKAPRGPGPRGVDLFSQPFGTAQTLMMFAYGVPRYRIAGGPAWITSEHFAILAKARAAPTRADMRVLVQQLLAERFAFVGHRDTRELPTYDLVMARADRRLGPNLTPAPVDCTPYVNGNYPPDESPAIERGGRMVPRCGTVFSWGNGFVSPMLMGRTMQQFAEYLSGATAREVIDKTGLSGAFDVDLTFAQDPVTPFLNQLPRREAPALLTALPEQLGLRLVSSKATVEVLVIDHIERPTEN